MRLKSQTWGIIFIMLATAVTNSFSQCDMTFMACNDFVQVSVNDSCYIVVSPDMILEAPVPDASEYQVMVFDGNIPLGDTIYKQYVNRVLEVSIRCLSSGISCWGYIGIEDKVPPVLEIFPSDTMISCLTPMEDFILTDTSGNPFAFVDLKNSIFTAGPKDLCGAVMDTTIRDDIIENGDCGINGVIRQITRTFAITDMAGNITTDTQIIQIKKAGLSEVIYPQDTTIDCRDLPSDGFNPDYFGRPNALSCDIFKSTYTDTKFPLCGGSYKILRTWYVVDWCDNRDTSVTQILESLDTVPPVWNDNFDDFDPGNTFAGSQECVGMITLPFEKYAAANDLCYALEPDDYRVTYRRGDITQNDGFEALIRTDVVIDPISHDAKITDLPLGIHQAIITATDACGNSSSATRIITIEDNTPPNAICERTTTVGLDFNGYGELMAFSLDDHSFDNCGKKDLRFEVKRLSTYCEGHGPNAPIGENDLEFGPSIHFCCEDIPLGLIKVVLRVYDPNDAFSECVVDVIVQDKRSIELSCRNDIVVDCDFNFNNLEQELGAPIVTSEVCLLHDPVLHIPDFTVDECGNAMFYVTWTISDYTTVRDSCKQKVTVLNLFPPIVSIPGDITIDGCDANGAHPEFINSVPTITDVDCETIAVSHQDHVDEDPATGCIHIKRAWTVIDWCTYNPLDPNTALSGGIQHITLTDNEAPAVLDCPSDLTVIDSDDNCSELVVLQLLASDNCSLSEDLIISYSIDLEDDGQGTPITGNGSDATDIFPTGTHRISWTVVDRCGNVNNLCSYRFTISNPFDPRFSGTQNVSINIQNNGSTATLTTANVGAAVSENCSESLSFSFAENEIIDQIVYDCSDIPNGVSTTIQQNLYVTGPQGNQRAFELSVFLTDNNDVCPDVNDGASVIIGKISDENNVIVQSVAVRLFDVTSGTSEVLTTNENGEYRFDNVSPTHRYTVSPQLTGNDALGVSSIDLVLMQRHILGLQPFQSPFLMIAADVNNSESISVSDLVLLQKLILGFDQQLSNNDPWRFVPGSHTLSQDNPYDFPQITTINSLNSGITTVDFTGVKVGDVNGNAFPALLDLTSDPRSSATIRYSIGQLSEDVYKVEFKLSKQMDITGFQFAIDAQNLTLAERKNGLIELRNDNINSSNGKIKISWINGHGQALDESPLFTFLVNANELNRLDLDNSFSAELYDTDLTIHRITLEKEKVGEHERVFQVFQNHPNPFSQATSISFILPERDKVELSIYDLTGKLLLSKSNVFDRGINQFRLNNQELPGNGVLYYTIETSKDIKGHKMILLQ